MASSWGLLMLQWHTAAGAHVEFSSNATTFNNQLLSGRPGATSVVSTPRLISLWLVSPVSPSQAASFQANESQQSRMLLGDVSTRLTRCRTARSFSSFIPKDGPSFSFGNSSHDTPITSVEPMGWKGCTESTSDWGIEPSFGVVKPSPTVGLVVAGVVVKTSIHTSFCSQRDSIGRNKPKSPENFQLTSR